MDKPKKNLGESLRQKLKNLSEKRQRPFDETIRYYAMERFLYRLSISPYANRFFLKGGLMLRVWDRVDHRATMDIDLLARTSNHIENLRKILIDISSISCPEDAVFFNTQKLILKETQTGGDYQGISASFLAELFTSKIPILIDIGFNDIVIPEPQKIVYPTLLPMSTPELLGYTPETVMAEKLESIIKLGLVNTRMKDFYDLWILFQRPGLNPERLALAIKEVFSNRNTKFEYPIAFTPAFFKEPETLKRWDNFLSSMGKKHIDFPKVIIEISNSIKLLMNV